MINMQQYIQQLIDDIHNSRTIVKPPSNIWNYADIGNEGEVEDMAYVEQYIYGTEVPMNEITGIDTQLLPPSHKLNKEQKEKLSTELQALLEYHNFIADFPAKFPLDKHYNFILGLWNDSFVEVSFGKSHIEFCSYDEEFYPFPGYCNICKEVTTQIETDERTSGSDNDNEIIIPF